MKASPVAIITGAGSGIGRATAVLLNGAGYRLALVGRTVSTLRATAKLCSGAPTEPLITQADVGDLALARQVIEASLAAFGRIDALVNNAAVCRTLPLERTVPEVLQTTFNANSFGPAMLVAHAWPTFVKQRRGCVVNVSSMSSIDPFPGLGLYGASKAALESLARSAVNEGRQHGIRAFNIAPGAVETAMLRQIVSLEDLPPSRTLKPQEVASVIVDCVLGRRDDHIGKTIILPS